MKYALIFLSILILPPMTIVGCRNNPEPFPYRYAHGDQVPDSLRDDMAKFITETMRACDQHLTTSDYEDVDDVVSEVRETAFKIYTVTVDGLEWNNPNDDHNWYSFIPYNQLTDKQKIIFDSLKVNQQ